MATWTTLSVDYNGSTEDQSKLLKVFNVTDNSHHTDFDKAFTTMSGRGEECRRALLDVIAPLFGEVEEAIAVCPCDTTMRLMAYHYKGGESVTDQWHTGEFGVSENSWRTQTEPFEMTAERIGNSIGKTPAIGHGFD